MPENVTMERGFAVQDAVFPPSKDTKSQESSIISKVSGVAAPIFKFGSYLQYAKYIPGLSNMVDCDGLARVGQAFSDVSDIQEGVSSACSESSSTVKKACGWFNTAVKTAKLVTPFLPEAAGVAFAAANPVLGMVTTAIWAGSTAWDIYRCIRG